MTVENVEKRFWSKVAPAQFWEDDTSAMSGSTCWEWKAYKCKDGYGRFYWPGGRGKKSTQRLAHRASVELTQRTLEWWEVVMHLCDNRGCVNPAHLRIGTAHENMQDMVEKGRHPTLAKPR